MTIHFGTDGWRAVISEDFTFANVARVTQAVADVVLATSAGAPLTYVVGYDTRFLSDRFAAAVACVLAANGIRVLLGERFAPTPAISYAIVHHQAAGGVMITASHNPPRYNGFKLKASFGGGANTGVINQVEQQLAVNERDQRQPLAIDFAAAVAQDLIVTFDPYPAYAAHIRRLIDFDSIAAAGLRIVIDAMYGAGIGYTDRLLREAGVEPITLHHEINPGFGGLHPEPIGRHLDALKAGVTAQAAHLGLATDGDADRIGAVDPHGRFIDPHRIMTLTLDYFLQQQKRGDVVKTVSTTQMLNLLAAEHSLEVFETPVGFNHIADLMCTRQVLIGGEESGGISIAGHIPEGDGVLMGLLLAELVARQGRSVDVLIEGVMDRIGHFAYARHDYAAPPLSKREIVQRLIANAPAALNGQPVRDLNTRDGVKYLLADASWLLIRPSGTEPVLRVYAEARSEVDVYTLLDAGAHLAHLS